MMLRTSFSFIFLLVAIALRHWKPAEAFQYGLYKKHTTAVSLATQLQATARQPRRRLKKRRGRRGRGEEGNTSDEDDFPWETAESRPLVQSYAKELGEDYWIDQEELQRSLERQAALKALEPGQIPKEKLWGEVLSPYRQNWIGYISVVVVIFAFIFQNFPEIINPPLIVNVPADL